MSAYVLFNHPRHQRRAVVEHPNGVMKLWWIPDGGFSDNRDNEGFTDIKKCVNFLFLIQNHIKPLHLLNTS